MKSVIYKILNKANGKFYIGSAANWTIRKKTHKYLLRHNKHINPHLQNSWNKYGEDSFEFLIIENVEPQNLLIREQVYLDMNPAYNICKVAGNRLGTKHSVTTKDKMSESHKGIKHSNETKKLMSSLKLGTIQTNTHISKRTSKMIDFYKSGSGNKGKFGHSNSKVIIQLDKDGNFLKRWNSSNEIYRETGYNHRNIRECCSGTKRKTAHGFKWKFENC